MTRIAAAITVDALDQALADAARAAEFGADLVELRIDRFTDDPDAVRQLVERVALPCILTCRIADEGGQYDGDEQTRIALLQHAALGSRQPAYIDLELQSHQRSANLRQKIDGVVDHVHQQRPTTTGLILSSHDFEKRPADLLQKVEAIVAATDCRVLKVAWHARSLRDNLEAFDLIAQQYKPTIALCMGEFGLPSRVLAKKFGALLTFAAIDADAATAPGQPTIAELKQLYRWDAQRSDTQVFGVIGDPVSHSKSPAIHNAGFDAISYNGVYLPMRIPPQYEHFKATVSAWLDYKPLHFCGASVTIPHKENLIRFVKEQAGQIEPLAQRIGAANTLTVKDDGSLYACNTDYAAALDAVCDSLKITRAQLKGKRVAVIGAGGVARAVVAGFTEFGCEVTIYNRTLARAEALAETFRAQAAMLDELENLSADVLINCTSVGMHPAVDATPVPAALLRAGMVVFDTIYNPVETLLLKQAKAAGCHTVTGRDMFTRQAAAQFEGWTNRPAPLDAFTAAMED